jgi:HNH endonuclease
MPNRARLYDKYSRDLSRFRQDLDGSYLCPLCVNAFTRKDLKTKVLSVEHVIPLKLGGRYVVLTCRTCNNTLGSELDSHLIGMVKAADGNDGLLPLQAIADIGGNRLRLELLLSKNPMDINEMKVIGKATNPNAPERAIQALQSGIDTISLKVNYQYIPQHADLAILKVVYLLTFGTRGYAFAFSPIGTLMRSEIKKPTTLLSKFSQLTARLDIADGAIPESFFLGDLSSLIATPVYIALFKLRTKRDHWFAATYPSEHADLTDPESTLDMIRKQTTGIELRVDVPARQP